MKSPEKIGDTVRLLASLAGYLGRKHDDPPGHQVIWRGYTYLQLMCEGYLLTAANGLVLSGKKICG